MQKDILNRMKLILNNMCLKIKEVIPMKRNKGLNPCWIIAILAMAITGVILFSGQGSALAAVTCPTSSTADADGDGFSDQQECDGIPLPNTPPGNIFPGKISGLPRADRLDPDTKDLFVILVPVSSGSLFPTNNPLEYVAAPQAQGGLGIAVHVINSNQATSSRNVTPTQKAVRVAESILLDDNVILGMASCGTPNGLDLATIYTKRIEKHVTTVKQAPNATLTENYIKHTIAHEVGHMLGPLAPKYVSSYGGNHYKSGTNVLMDQSVYYKGTTFYIGTTFTSSDKTGMKLK